MNFVFIFAAKLAINNDMSKDFFKELTPVAIRDYYKSLSKKDKGNFLQFLVANCDLGYSTLINRFYTGKIHTQDGDIDGATGKLVTASSAGTKE
jgi:hypothetical protein